MGMAGRVGDSTPQEHDTRFQRLPLEAVSYLGLKPQALMRHAVGV